MLAKSRLSQLFIFTSTLFASSVAFGCRCTQITLSEAYKRADAVLYGYTSDFVRLPSPEGGGTAIIEVESSWKSNLPNRLVVNTQTSCAFDFEKGNHYLLFLNKSETGFYETGMCYGNIQLEYKTSLDAELKSLSEKYHEKSRSK